METEDAPTPATINRAGSLKRIEDRHVNDDVKLMVWSDRMDLLALANTKSEVHLYRLNWQRVWILSPKNVNDTVTALAWQPDGKVIAIGYQTGNVALVDVETKCVMNNFTTSPIETLTWLNLGNDSYLKQIRNKSVFPLQMPSVTANASSKTCPLFTLLDVNRPNILLVGDQQGGLLGLIYGVFVCCALTDIIDGAFKITSIFLSRDLQTFFVVAEMLNEPAQTRIVYLDAFIFETHALELQTIAYTYVHIHRLLEFLQTNVTSMVESWENVFQEMHSKFTAYASDLPEGKVGADFLELFLMGTQTAALESFLVHKLTEKGLQKLGLSVEMSFGEMQDKIIKVLLQIAQQIAFHLIELRGYARMVHRYNLIGLDERVITRAISASGSFLLKVVELQQVCDHSLLNYRTFFTWLDTVILRMTDEPVPLDIAGMTQQQIKFISDFLYTMDCQPSENTFFNLEKVGQYLVDEPLKQAADTPLNPWSKFLADRADELTQNGREFDDILVNHHADKSLIQEQKSLSASVDEIFAKHDIINDAYKITGTVNLNISSASSSFVGIEATPFALASFVDRNNRDFVYILQMNSELREIKGVACFVTLNEHKDSLDMDAEQTADASVYDSDAALEIIDAKFYTYRVLSLLLRSKTTQTCYFQQVSIDALPWMSARVWNGLDDLPKINLAENASNVLANVKIPNRSATRFAISSVRKVAAVLLNERRILLYDTEAEEDD